MKYHTFLPKFHDLIRQKSKQTTIRGRTLVKPGETFALRHWIGKAYRSPMGILGTAFCEYVHPIEIGSDDVLLNGFIAVDLDTLARRDGFASWAAMRDHFIAARGLPFVGVLIAWGDTFQPSAAS